MKEYKVKVFNFGDGKTKVVGYDGDKIISSHYVRAGDVLEGLIITEEPLRFGLFGSVRSESIDESKLKDMADAIEACKIPTDNITAFADSKIDEVTIAGKDYKLGKGVNIEGLARQRDVNKLAKRCLLYTSPSPRDRQKSRMPSSA